MSVNPSNKKYRSDFDQFYNKNEESKVYQALYEINFTEFANTFKGRLEPNFIVSNNGRFYFQRQKLTMRCMPIWMIERLGPLFQNFRLDT